MRLLTSMTTAALLAGAMMMPTQDANAGEEAPVDEWGVQMVTAGNNALALEMYRELISGGDSGSDSGANVFFSPMSISSALSLTYEGARGQTMVEFEQVLGVPSDTLGDWGRPQYHGAMGSVLGMLDGDDKPYELAVANSLWGEQSLPFSQAFVNELNDNYEAGLELVDFKGDFENQRVRINDWVAERTHDRIQDLLPEDSLDDLTRLVLVNAIYFKAEWATQFNERATQDAAFHLFASEAGDTDDPVSVPMMRHHEKSFNHADFEGYDAIELRYQGRDLSMLVLLPDEVDGLTELESQLTPELIAETVEAMSFQAANVWLPKWEMTLDYDLIPALKAMGMERAFDDRRADFTGISDSAEGEALHITGVFHKAFIAVDEEGTEAAAATALSAPGSDTGGPTPEIVEFRADHPFIYLIRDNRTGAILFLGRVTDPS